MESACGWHRSVDVTVQWVASLGFGRDGLVVKRRNRFGL